MKGIHRFGMAGAAGAVALAVILAAFHAIQPGLSPTEHFVSEYAYGALGWLFTVGYCLAGLGTLLSAWALAAGAGGWRGRTSAACLVLVGLGLVGTGVTRIDLAGPDGTIVSTASGQAHELAGYLAIVGMIPGAFLVASAIARDPSSAGSRTTARLLAVGVLAGFLLVIAAQRIDLPGLGQRLFLVAALSWLAWLGWTMGHATAGLPSRPGRTSRYDLA